MTPTLPLDGRTPGRTPTEHRAAIAKAGARRWDRLSLTAEFPQWLPCARRGAVLASGELPQMFRRVGARLTVGNRQ